MQTLQNTAKSATQSMRNDICGCITLGGILFMMSTLAVLMTSSTAQAFINAAQ